MVSVRRERHRFAPSGMLGGHGSVPCETELEYADGRVESLPGIARRMIDYGAIVRVKTTGSGGYGSPLQRPAERVLDDVLDGRVSVKAARDVYGVVIDNGVVDWPKTDIQRQALAVG